MITAAEYAKTLKYNVRSYTAGYSTYVQFCQLARDVWSAIDADGLHNQVQRILRSDGVAS